MTSLRILACFHLLLATAGVLGSFVAVLTAASDLPGLGLHTAAALLAAGLPLLFLAATALSARTPSRAALAGLAAGSWTFAVLALIWATQVFPFVVFLLVVPEVPALTLALLPTLLIVVLSARLLLAPPRRGSSVEHLCSDG